METTNDKVTDTAQNTISIERTFDLPINTIWKAWSEAESFKKWWGPKEYTCPDCTIDFKVGGKYIANMRSKDGKENWSTGSYKEIVPQMRIVYADSFCDSKGNIVPGSEYGMPEMPMQSLVTVELDEVDGKTNMTLHHKGIPEKYADDCTKGWNSCFDKMESNLK
ncbi:MAG: SRPBCC domain-containing protein [Bacteroidetes bacterium]|nr:SRPBCC domain-containing protein [Bacteroidota bacterium]